MKRYSRWILATLLLLSASPLAAAPADAPAPEGDDLERLVRKADRVQRGNRSAAVVGMRVKTSSYDRTYRMVIWDDAKKDRSLIKILDPAMWRGTGTLKVGNVLKMYDPRTDQVTQISHSMLGDNWMGSHFTNDDLVKETQMADHYGQELIKKYEGKDEAGEAATYYDIKLTPKPTAPVVWGRVEMTLYEKGDIVIPTRMTYFRRVEDEEAFRTLSFSQVKEMGGRWLPAYMKMTVKRKPGEYTAFEYQKLKFDPPMDDSRFTEQSLKQ